MQFRQFVIGLTSLTAISGALLGCRQEKQESATLPEPRSFLVEGDVTELKPDGLTALIRHDEIPGYMAAMTMPLAVKDAQDWEGVNQGDRISFRMLVTKDDGWIDQIIVIGKQAQPIESPPIYRKAPEVTPLEIGDLVPNYQFTNELGKAVSIRDFEGDVTAFTFIFTRCPFPTFCPRMSSRFEGASNRLTEKGQEFKNWKFLSISIDPEFDTPDILKAYAAQYTKNPSLWSFVTGGLDQIDPLGEQFGLIFSREPGSSTINHNLRTVIMTPSNRVHQVFVGNEWTSKELVAAMESAKQPALDQK